MKKRLQARQTKSAGRAQRLLEILVELAIVTTALFALSAPAANTIYLFLLFYALLYWKRKRVQKLLPRSAKLIPPMFMYVLMGTLGAILFELTLTQLPFHPNPLVDFLIGSGFYLPYFALWYKLIQKFKFSFLEVYYLAGLGRVIFDAVVTRKLFVSAGIGAFGAATIVTFTLFGAVSSLPYLLLLKQEKEQLKEKPFKEYLIGLSPGFIAAVVLLVWIGVLKLLITKVLQL